MNLFVCLRPNHVLKALLWSFYNGTKDDIFVIAVDEVPEMMAISERMKSDGFTVKNLNLLEINSRIINKDHKLNSLLRIVFHKKYIDALISCDKTIIFNKNINNLFLFYDQSFACNYILQKCYKLGTKIFLIEDGTANYKRQKRPFKKNYRFLAGIYPLGYNPKINSIYLLSPDHYRGLFNSKVKILDKKYVQLTSDEAFNRIINRIFLPNLPDKLYFDSKVVVILTQPLDRMNIISKELQHKIYKKIATVHGGACVIKKHPQDKNSYESFSTFEIDGSIPFEVISNFFPKDASFVTLYSSTILHEPHRLIKLIDPDTRNIGEQVQNLLGHDLSSIFH